MSEIPEKIPTSLSVQKSGPQHASGLDPWRLVLHGLATLVVALQVAAVAWGLDRGINFFEKARLHSWMVFSMKALGCAFFLGDLALAARFYWVAFLHGWSEIGSSPRSVVRFYFAPLVRGFLRNRSSKIVVVYSIVTAIGAGVGWALLKWTATGPVPNQPFPTGQPGPPPAAVLTNSDPPAEKAFPPVTPRPGEAPQLPLSAILTNSDPPKENVIPPVTPRPGEAPQLPPTSEEPKSIPIQPEVSSPFHVKQPILVPKITPEPRMPAVKTQIEIEPVQEPGKTEPAHPAIPADPSPELSPATRREEETIGEIDITVGGDTIVVFPQTGPELVRKTTFGELPRDFEHLRDMRLVVIVQVDEAGEAAVVSEVEFPSNFPMSPALRGRLTKQVTRFVEKSMWKAARDDSNQPITKQITLKVLLGAQR